MCMEMLCDEGVVGYGIKEYSYYMYKDVFDKGTFVDVHVVVTSDTQGSKCPSVEYIQLVNVL